MSPMYRVKYTLYRIEAPSAMEAKKKVVNLLKTQADDLLSVEDASIFDDRRPMWRRFLFG